MHLDVDIGDNGNLRHPELNFGQASREFVGGGLHQARMEGSGHWQLDGAAAAAGLGALECAGDRCLLARDHDLAGRIEVDGLDAPRLASFGDGGLNRIVGEAR